MPSDIHRAQLPLATVRPLHTPVGALVVDCPIDRVPSPPDRLLAPVRSGWGFVPWTLYWLGGPRLSPWLIFCWAFVDWLISAGYPIYLSGDIDYGGALPRTPSWSRRARREIVLSISWRAIHPLSIVWGDDLAEVSIGRSSSGVLPGLCPGPPIWFEQILGALGGDYLCRGSLFLLGAGFIILLGLECAACLEAQPGPLMLCSRLQRFAHSVICAHYCLL